MMSLHNHVEKHATQIQAVHRKNKEIQIALSTMFRIAYYPFRGGGGMQIIQTTQLNKVNKGRQKRRILEIMIICIL